MSGLTKYMIAALTIICVYSLFYSRKIEKYEQNNIVYEDSLTSTDMSNDKFKIQYQVKGILSTDLNKDKILTTIKKAVAKMERIVAKSNKLNYITEDTEIPNTFNDKKFIKDIYIIITISDANIKEDSGAESLDTIGSSNIKETQLSGSNILPVVGTMQLLKSNVLSDLNLTFDTIKYPYAVGLNQFYYTFMHELFHVLGVGFLWTEPDYDASKNINYYNRYWIDLTNNNPVYIGPSLSKYNGLSATVYQYSKFIGKPGQLKAMPIENDGLSGTKINHWEKGFYKDDNGIIVSKDDRVIDGIYVPGLINEIMVGWTDPDKPPIISTVTIANLEDLGYVVNYGEAEVNSFSKMIGQTPIPVTQETPYVPDSIGTMRQIVASEMAKYIVKPEIKPIVKPEITPIVRPDANATNEYINAEQNQIKNQVIQKEQDGNNVLSTVCIALTSSSSLVMCIILFSFVAYYLL